MINSSSNSTLADGSCEYDGGQNFTSTGSACWVLCAQSERGESAKRFVINGQPFTIGRHPDNNLCIANPTVSGQHAELIVAGDQLLIRDHNSTNGTLLNGRPIQTVESLNESDILHFGSVMFILTRAVCQPNTQTMTEDNASEAIAQVQFANLLARPGIQPCYQPIVRLDTTERVGYEILSRSQFIGLETPDKMFRVAAQRTLESELSRVCRLEGMRCSAALGKDFRYYLNTHPEELNRPELIDSLHSLRNLYPDDSITLEVHESGVTSLEYLRELKAVLQDLNMQLAYDDFGSGQARLMELIEVPPHVLKFDVKFVQGLPTASDSRRSTIASLIRIVQDLGVAPLAEGVETEEEAAVCRELGFVLAQGYLFGKGEPASKWTLEDS